MGRRCSSSWQEADEVGSGVRPGSGARKEYVDEFVYDLLDRVVTSHRRRESSTGEDGSPADIVRTFVYDSLGHTVKSSDTLGAGQETRYDALGRARSIKKVPTSSSGSGAATIEMLLEFLDAGEAGNGRPTVRRRDGIGRLTSYVFDPAVRLSEVRNPGYAGGAAHRTLFEYDPASNVEYLTDGNSTRVQQTFDAANRLLTRQVVTLGAGVSVLATRETFSYDALSRLSTTSTWWGMPSTNPLVDVLYTWDSLDRAKTETFSYFPGLDMGQLPRTVASSYDIPGGTDVDFDVRRGVAYPSGFALRHTPDRLGRLSAVERSMPNGGAMNALAEYRHVGARPLQRTLHFNAGTNDWHSTLFTWDGQRRLTTPRVSGQLPPVG